VIAVRPWPLPSAGVSISISQQLRLRPRQLCGRRPGCGRDGARFSKEARLYLWNYAPRGRRRSCVIGVGPSKQDHADLGRRYHASHSPNTLRSKIRPFANCRLERAPPQCGIRLNSNSPLTCESCESGERRGRKKRESDGILPFSTPLHHEWK
jgi:hypothetical protein